MTERLQKDAAKAINEQILAEAEGQDQHGEDFVVTKESKKKAIEKQTKLLQEMAQARQKAMESYSRKNKR